MEARVRNERKERGRVVVGGGEGFGREREKEKRVRMRMINITGLTTFVLSRPNNF